MKKIRINTCLNILIIPLLLIALLLPTTAFASQTDSGVEVIAHIEASEKDNSSSVIKNTDSKSPQTGNNNIPTAIAVCLNIGMGSLFLIRKIKYV